MLRQLFLYLSENRTLNERIITSAAARRTASRFVAGETLQQAVAVVRSLNAEGMTASLDLLGEKTSDQKSALLAADQYVTILRTRVHRPLQPRLAHRAPGLPDAGAGASRGHKGRGMTCLREGKRW